MWKTLILSYVYYGKMEIPKYRSVPNPNKFKYFVILN